MELHLLQRWKVDPLIDLDSLCGQRSMTCHSSLATSACIIWYWSHSFRETFIMSTSIPTISKERRLVKVFWQQNKCTLAAITHSENLTFQNSWSFLSPSTDVASCLLPPKTSICWGLSHLFLVKFTRSRVVPFSLVNLQAKVTGRGVAKSPSILRISPDKLS